MKRLSLHNMYSRRTFLRTAAAGAAGLLLADRILADPYAPPGSFLDDARPVRVRGRVVMGGRPTEGVVITDGVSVVATDADGAYALHTTHRQQFVSCSLPGNADIPLNATGTARIYAPITPEKDGEAVASWELTRAEHDLGRHGFLVLADPQTLDEEDIGRFHAETVPDVQRVVRETDVPLFAVGCGDLMFDRLQYFPEYEKAIGMMGIPGFQVLGNHDVETAATSDGPSARTFLKHFGPNYYSFNRGEVHYVVLDDVLWLGGGYIGYIDDVQLEWLRQDLAFVEKGSRVIVFAHIPVYNKQHERHELRRASRSEIVTNRQALYRILEGYDTHIVSGHMHESEHLRDGGATHHVCGAVCGGWWTGDICGDGTPNGYAVYTVTGSGFGSAYKSTGRAHQYQAHMYRQGSHPDFPQDIIANVWDAHDGWTVAMLEDGVRHILTTGTPMKDPLAMSLLDGDDRPRKHSWVDAYIPDHMYRYTPKDPDAPMILEATDPEGRTYTLDTFTPVES